MEQPEWAPRSHEYYPRTEATHPEARVVTKKSVNEIAREPNETLAATAGRLVDVFRASTVDRDVPLASEMTSFWRYILPADDFQDLIWRFSVLVTPAASEKIVQKATTVVLIHQAANELKLRPVGPHGPMSPAMRQRVTVTCRIMRQPVDSFAAGKEDETRSRVGLYEDVDAHEVPGSATPRNARMESPRMVKNRMEAIPGPKSPRTTCSSLDAAQLASSGRREGRRYPVGRGGRQW